MPRVGDECAAPPPPEAPDALKGVLDKAVLEGPRDGKDASCPVAGFAEEFAEFTADPIGP
jgi:hypothetical protein